MTPASAPTPMTAARGSRSRAAIAGVRDWARREPLALAAIAVGMVARLVYWQVTERMFEDGLITVAHARSVVEGIGLTHHDYEPVTHGFTSALSVLVPVLGELAGELVSPIDGFLALRLFSLVAFVITIVLANSICRELGVAKLPRAFVLLFLAIDYNQILYGMAGMETQMAVAILLGAALATIRRATVAAGVLFGLCLLVRPDFALFVGPALVALFVWQRRDALRAGAIAGAIVGPWLIFTKVYYGSPIPNTIRAKSLRYHTDYPGLLNPGEWWDFASQQIAARETWWHTFTPFLENGFVTDAPILPFFSAAIAVVFIGLGLVGAAVSWRLPGWRPALAFMALFVVYRFAALPDGYYEWYYPPFTALLAICAGVGLTQLARLGPRTAGALALGLVALFAWPYPAHVVIDGRIQHDIEDKVRWRLGWWLRDNVPPGQTVTSESAGYLGYYGRVKLFDYPGLTSKQAVAIMKRLGWRRNSMMELVNAARPEFVVWRPNELAAFQQMFPDAALKYREVARFSVDPNASQTVWGGVSYVNIDRDFIVVRKTP
ncbi:MAG: hypothetical protein H0U00_11830 [Actinobacteria bacterium]|nr:hypothetical protein [Actinomycetota bacterium]